MNDLANRVECLESTDLGVSGKGRLYVEARGINRGWGGIVSLSRPHTCPNY